MNKTMNETVRGLVIVKRKPDIMNADEIYT
jgi:hypothetical protein